MTSRILTAARGQVAFTGADVVIMLGAFPRKDGMERKDLLEKNCGIFKEQVRACVVLHCLLFRARWVFDFRRGRVRSGGAGYERAAVRVRWKG